jgi:rhodanese-related sulfurtransferase
MFHRVSSPTARVRGCPGTGAGAGIADALPTGMQVHVYDTARPMRGGYRDVSPSAAYQARETLRLVDVREPLEYTGPLGHIPGAELVPLDTLDRHLGSWDKDANIILICRSGARSSRAAETLARAGFRRVMNMAGGMVAYNAEQLPIVLT